MKRLRNFFWLCSGASHQLLEDTPSESSKYAGIGATIFFTGVFAALAGVYAMYSVFDSYWIATLAGLIWGAMIFNLDRYIVSSMRKREQTIDELKIALPRFILAVLIALVISKPLELKIFEKEINKELVTMQLEDRQLKEDLVKLKYTQEREMLMGEIAALKLEVDKKTLVRDSLRLRAQVEADGTGGTMRRNAGPIYAIKKSDADKVEAELEQLTARNLGLTSQKQARIDEIERSITSEIQAIEAGALGGLAARLDALSRLTAKSSAVWMANWFIILLFIAIESAPVLVKLMSPTGPYDYALESVEYKHQAEFMGDRAMVNKMMKRRVKKMPAYEKEFVDEQLEVGLANGSKM